MEKGFWGRTRMAISMNLPQKMPNFVGKPVFYLLLPTYKGGFRNLMNLMK
jgi:hypothetical protein